MKDWCDDIDLTFNDEEVKKHNSYNTQRVDPFNQQMYFQAMEKYNKDLIEYKKKNWFIRLFSEKPVKPDIKWFVM